MNSLNNESNWSEDKERKSKKACPNFKPSDSKESNFGENLCCISEKKDLPEEGCETCWNIASYCAKTEKASNNEDHVANVVFPGPGVVKKNNIYGNYVVASRTINPGELIIQERPITYGPYSDPEILPLCLCLTCCKDIGLFSKCSKCKWPVCGKDCEKFYMHANNECSIFANSKVKCTGLLKEYFSVEVLRCLLLRDRSPPVWERVLEFEPHIDARSNDHRAKNTADFIISFIRDKCSLSSVFSLGTIEHVVGILSINTFWAYKDLNRFTSCLFDKSTLLAHDCDPNADRKLVFLKEDLTTEDVSKQAGRGVGSIALRVTAKRKIMPGEMLTIGYISLNQPVTKRREELKQTFYFDCTCKRCLTELEKEEKERLIDLKLQEASL